MPCINRHSKAGSIQHTSNLYTLSSIICQGAAMLFIFIATVPRVLSVHFVLFIKCFSCFPLPCTLTFTLTTKWWISPNCVFLCDFLLSVPFYLKFPIGRSRLLGRHIQTRKDQTLDTVNWKVETCSDDRVILLVHVVSPRDVSIFKFYFYPNYYLLVLRASLQCI